KERFFCRFLCPMGAVFALMPVLPVFSLHRDREDCIKGCRGCTSICPADIELPDVKSSSVRGECFQCGKCIDVCPKKHIRTGIRRLKGSEYIYTIIRAAVLAFIFKMLNV
ncbi:MAG: 4Fe-4S binding protein, partial [Candidatus Weimeria sp.]